MKEDLDQGIIAVWHDESQWNRYCLDFNPDVILNPSYCFSGLTQMGYSKELDALQREKFPPKLVALTKNHAEYRN